MAKIIITAVFYLAMWAVLAPTGMWLAMHFGAKMYGAPF